MTKPKDHAKKLDAASGAVRDLLNGLMKDGHDDQVLGDALLGYSLVIMERHHGRDAVARHLYMLSLKFHDKSHDPLKTAQSSH